jgi:hypothetical protein
MAFARDLGFEESFDRCTFCALSGDRVYVLHLRLHDCYTLEPPVFIPPSIGISATIYPNVPMVEDLGQ